MLIDWPAEFDRALDRLEAGADAGDVDARRMLDLIYAQLAVLSDLTEPPSEDGPTLRRVQQSKKYRVWRLSHPFVPGLAVRTIAWFAPDGTVVVALFSNNKAQMGDVFYSSVGSRADQIIDQWYRERQMNDE